MKKDIRKIAEKAGFEVKIYRHGCYTVYVLNKGELKMRLCRISDKGISHFEIMTNCKDFANPTQYPKREIIGFDTYKFALANGTSYYALLTMDEVIAVIEAN